MNFLDSFSADFVQFGWRDPLGSRRSYYSPIGALQFADSPKADQLQNPFIETSYIRCPRLTGCEAA